jgi:hypothetical protein
MLTNTDAADRYRAAGEPQLNQITAAIPTPDAELRASLLGAIVVHGVIIERCHGATTSRSPWPGSAGCGVGTTAGWHTI